MSARPRRRSLLPAYATLLIVANLHAADVTVSLVPEIPGPVAPGEDWPYRIELRITDNNGPQPADGLCTFVFDLFTDWSIEQPALDRFSDDVADSFDGAESMLGEPDQLGNIFGIAGSQNCIADFAGVIGVGIGEQTVIAHGTLRMPGILGVHRAEIRPVQIQLIASDSSGSLTPANARGSSFSITVAEPGDPPGDDGNGDDDTPGGDGGGDDDGGDGDGDGDGGTGGDDSGGDSPSDGNGQAAVQALCGAGILPLLPIALLAGRQLTTTRRTP